MEVILRQDIDGVGRADDIVKVKDGFARNFLIPKALAVPCTEANRQKLEAKKKSKLAELEKAKKETQDLKNKLESLSLTIPVLVQDDDKLYGNISSLNIVEALKEEGFDIAKHAVLLDEPIKALGIYEVPIKLHPEVTAKVKIWIVKK